MTTDQVAPRPEPDTEEWPLQAALPATGAGGWAPLPSGPHAGGDGRTPAGDGWAQTAPIPTSTTAISPVVTSDNRAQLTPGASAVGAGQTPMPVASADGETWAPSADGETWAPGAAGTGGGGTWTPATPATPASGSSWTGKKVAVAVALAAALAGGTGFGVGMAVNSGSSTVQQGPGGGQFPGGGNGGGPGGMTGGGQQGTGQDGTGQSGTGQSGTGTTQNGATVQDGTTSTT
jgi:hypothetical protein